MMSQSNQTQNQTNQSATKSRNPRAKKNVKINVEGEIKKNIMSETPSEAIQEIETEKYEEPAREIETKKYEEPITVEETEEEREIREDDERIALEMARNAKRRAEMKAKKDIYPLREAEKKTIMLEREAVERIITQAKKQLSEATASLQLLDEKIDFIDKGGLDSVLVSRVGDRMAEVAKREVQNVGRKIEIVEERGRGRERERDARAKSPAPRERSRSVSRERGANRILPKLEMILQQPTRLMYRVYAIQNDGNSGECYADTERGDKIIYTLDGDRCMAKSLSIWINTLEEHYNNGKNIRKLKVYETKKDSVFYFNTRANKWNRLGDDVNESTLSLNPI